MQNLLSGSYLLYSNVLILYAGMSVEACQGRNDSAGT